tara:strand:+ start:1278 stop:2144 length:867 start_codon:yes stop_codon:yes gene_type:complete
MANIKHNKIKNIGVLFELLTRQITSDTINGIEKSPAITIVKEFFNKNSYLTKELNLFKALSKQKYKTENNANRFIDLVINEHSKLSSSKLNREKYNLIKEIKINYKLDDFFKSHIPNYKLNASIYTLLESKNIKRVQKPSLTMKSRFFLTEHILEKFGSTKTNKDNIIKEYSKQDQDLRLLSYKILLEKFNTKYGKLNIKQKNLLKEYINNINNNSTLKKYIINEINVVNKAIGLLKNKVTNNVVKIKLNEVSQQLNLIKKENKIRDKHLVSVLRSYNLIKELRNVTK